MSPSSAAANAELLEHFGVVHAVDLVERDHGVRAQSLGDVAIARTDRSAGLEQENTAVDVVERRRRRLVEAVSEGRARPVHTRRVREDDLAVRPVEDATDAGPGGMGRRRGDGDLPPEDLVEQGRLADVRPADEGDEAGAESGLCVEPGRSPLAGTPDVLIDVRRSPAALAFGPRRVIAGLGPLGADLAVAPVTPVT